MVDHSRSVTHTVFALIHNEQNILTHGEVVDGILAHFLESQFLSLARRITTAGLEQEKPLTGGNNENIVAFAPFNNVVSLEEFFWTSGSNPVVSEPGPKNTLTKSALMAPSAMVSEHSA